MEQISSVKINSNNYKITFRKIARAAAAEVRVHKKIAIITLVLYGVAFLLFAFDGYIFGRPEKIVPGDFDTYGEFEPSGWGTAFAIGGIVVSFFTALNVFRDANNQQLCDVAMALPIKAAERFFSKLLCLFYIQTAPLIVSVLGGNSLAIMFGAMRFHGYLDPETPRTLFLLTLALLAASLFIMSIVVLCACCCGAVAESAYFSIILMFITNALPIAFVDNIIANTSGFSHRYGLLFSSNDIGINVKYWGFLSLIGNDEMQTMLQCGISCLISLAVMFSAIFIFKKRDARTVGTPIASRVFFEIIMAAACFTVFMLGAMGEGAMWGVLIAAVAYVIVNIIVTRAKINFKSFLIWSGKFLATLAACTVLMVAMVKTGAFGFYKTRPETKYLEGAVFTVKYTGYNGYFYGSSNKIASDKLTAEQADEVMKICQKHISHGIMNVNPFDVIFDQSAETVRVEAYSNEYYTPCPHPSFQFDYHYDDSHFARLNDAFSLKYSQRLRVSPNDANALFKELEQLDYFHKIDLDDYSYSETVIPV